MKKIEYICNLCGETSPKKEMFEYYFNCGVIPQQYQLQEVKDQCDRHVCKKCVLRIIETSPAGITLP